MTGIDIREALHEVAAATAAPERDDLALRRLVRRERRRRLAGRASIGVAAAVAVVTVVATTVLPFVGDEQARDLPPATGPGGAAHVELETPVALVADRRLTVVDPQGGVHDLGLVSEDVIGYTAESIYAVDDESRVVRFDVTNSDEGPGGPWEFDRVASGVEGPVQSAQLSPDGRWLGWIDLEERLHVLDLKAGSAAEPLQLPANSYLADLAQGTGAPLVSEDGDLALYAAAGEVAVPTRGDGYGWVSTATRDLVAVVDRDARTRVYDVATGSSRLVGTVDGTGVLSPYGDHLVSVAFDGTDAGRALLWQPGDEPAELDVPGRPQAAAWADEDTALVTTADGSGTALYACDVAGPGCARLPLDGAEDVSLPR